MKDEVIGNFRIVEKVGAGGMGEVYVAEQKDLGTRVAIEVLLEQISRDRDQVPRFFNEAIAPTAAITRDPEARGSELPRRRFPIAIVVGLVVAAGGAPAIYTATRGGKAQPIDAGLAIHVEQ